MSAGGSVAVESRGGMEGRGEPPRDPADWKEGRWACFTRAPLGRFRKSSQPLHVKPLPGRQEAPCCPVICLFDLCDSGRSLTPSDACFRRLSQHGEQACSNTGVSPEGTWESVSPDFHCPSLGF